MKTGIELIAEERQRQVTIEGYSADGDSAHEYNELALAAICYATPTTLRESDDVSFVPVPNSWPWHRIHWKPTPEDRVRELVKAGALIAAEIDRLNNLS